MRNTPTYEELLEQVRTLTKELEATRERTARLERRASRHREAEHMALMGHWELDLNTDTLHWSDEIYRIFDLDPEEFGATYEAFLEAIHPDDREYVNQEYSKSLATRKGYDIVHRLLLKNGTLKYVHEKCVTRYNEEGTAVRSLGTVQDVTHRYIDDRSFLGIIGKHPKMQAVFETILDLAEVDVPVLIRGESGTGKELVARAIHQKSARSARPFVPVNCGALPETLLESELFGHVKGAFTGAIRNKKGRFELADGGTLFLDEIVDLPKSMQVKLLRVLQEGEFEMVGGEQTKTVNVRIISAANRDLKREVDHGNFREDLYYRIKVVPIELPSLRERRSDIPLLLDHFTGQAVREGYRFAGFEDRAMRRLIDYDWPGNVRELQSAVHYALIKSRGEPVSEGTLPIELGAPAAVSPVVTCQRNRRSVRRAEAVGKGGSSPRLTVEQVTAALLESRGNKVQAARILGVGRATLYRFLADHDI